MSIFSTFDFTHLQTEAVWLLIIYLATFIAMTFDCITGVIKAKKAGIARTSRGFRRTAEKAEQYFLPMICLTMIDVIASAFLDYPILTAFMGAFNIYIEIRSIWENTHTIQETEKQQQCAKDLLQFISDHKEDIEKFIIK